MFLFHRPDDASILRYLETKAEDNFCYEGVGITAAGPQLLRPGQNFAVDHSRTRLGSGAARFRSAKAALACWSSVRLGWVEPFPVNSPIQPGSHIAIIAYTLGLWSINPGRIVYVVDEQMEDSARYGFAYGTLPGHAAAGEERFLVEWDRSTGEVFYDVLAFSRPHHWLARIAYPYLRLRQRRFARESAVAMQRAVMRPLLPPR